MHQGENCAHAGRPAADALEPQCDVDDQNHGSRQRCHQALVEELLAGGGGNVVGFQQLDLVIRELALDGGGQLPLYLRGKGALRTAKGNGHGLAAAVPQRLAGLDGNGGVENPLRQGLHLCSVHVPGVAVVEDGTALEFNRHFYTEDQRACNGTQDHDGGDDDVNVHVSYIVTDFFLLAHACSPPYSFLFWKILKFDRDITISLDASTPMTKFSSTPTMRV